MKKNTVKRVISLFLGSIFSVSLIGADTRTENIDVFILLDKSLSMVQEISEVREYVSSSLIESLLIPGDRIVVIAFYGRSEVIIDETVQSDAGKEAILSRIDSVHANGRFTDIGNALDSLNQVVQSRQSDRRRYLLLITDGIQEAPKESKYYTPDGSFNHAFLEHAKTIQMGGWKVQILGIGTETAVREIAEELSGVYSEVPEGATATDIAGAVSDFLGVVSITGTPIFSKVGSNGRSDMTLVLQSTGYQTERIIRIEELVFSHGSSSQNILEQQVEITIPPESSLTKQIEVRISGLNGPARGTLTFTTNGDTAITPGLVEVSVETSSGLPLPLIAGIAGGILAIAIVIILLTRKGSGKKTAFSLLCEIGERYPKKETFRLLDGETLFIGESGGVLGIGKKQTGNVVGQITRVADTIKCTVINALSFPSTLLPENLLGKSIKIKKRDGTSINISFSRLDK